MVYQDHFLCFSLYHTQLQRVPESPFKAREESRREDELDADLVTGDNGIQSLSLDYHH